MNKKDKNIVSLFVIIGVVACIFYLGNNYQLSIVGSVPSTPVQFSPVFDGETRTENCAYQSGAIAIRFENVPEDYKQEFVAKGLANASYTRVYCDGNTANCGGLDSIGEPTFELGSDGNIYVLAHKNDYTTSTGGRPGDGTTCHIFYHVEFSTPSGGGGGSGVCGDHVCDGGETEATCALDCKVVNIKYYKIMNNACVETTSAGNNYNEKIYTSLQECLNDLEKNQQSNVLVVFVVVIIILVVLILVLLKIRRIL